ncbi:MAG: class IV adenylate cyclase [bacterium]
MQEIEVKFLNIDIGVVQRRLEYIGAKKDGEYFQRWKVFDYPDWRLDKDGSWLRLRDEGDGRITLTFKKRLGMQSREGAINDLGMEEIELQIDSFDNAVCLFAKIGFIEKHYAEKRRIRWKKDDTEFDIDIYPELEPYLEIETTSWDKIDEAIEILGFDQQDKKIFSANQVYALKGIKVADLERITFAEGLVKRPKEY